MDVAKRFIDYGFHAPTLSFPVAGTLMVEPTESEPLEELDRFVEAMRSIRGEIDEVIAGRTAVEDSALRYSPHTLAQVASDEWDRAYPRSRAAFPEPSLVRDKYFPPVSRIDNARIYKKVKKYIKNNKNILGVKPFAFYICNAYRDIARRYIVKNEIISGLF